MTAAKELPAQPPRELEFPPKAMMYSGTILGTRGAGKSRTAQGLFEYELDLGHRCGFIDPMGDSAGIRLNPDDTPSRFQHVVIFGGPNCDIPITEEDGAKVARLVATNNISFICDISEMGDTEKQRFVSAFADALFNEIKLPILLFIDEAHIFAPQNQREANTKLLNRMATLNTRGRKKGIFLWLMTQRVARINKNVISGAEVLIAMRMGMKLDIEVISDWLDLHDAEHGAEVKGKIAGLGNGEAFVSIPLLKTFKRVQFPMPTTKDIGHTPEHGETVGGVALPKIDVGKIADLFGATGAGDDPRDAEIERLTRQVTRLREQLTERDDQLRSANDQKRIISLARDGLMMTLTETQDRIGMLLGSPAIEALDADIDPDTVIMVLGQDGVVRPIWREGAMVARMSGGRRQMRQAIVPAGKVKP